MTYRKSLEYTPSPALNTLQIFALATIAIAIPLLSFLKANPNYFVANAITPSLIYTAALSISILLPVALILVLLISRIIHARLYLYLHHVTVFALLTVYCLSILSNISPIQWIPPLLIITLAGLIAAIIFHLYRINRYIYISLALLAPLTLITPIYFLTDEKIQEVLHSNKPLFTLSETLEAETTPPVIMMVFDEFPLISLLDAHGNIDTKRFPNFGRFAQQSTWYSNATTVHGRTLQSIPSILTGNYPRTNDILPLASNYPDSLFNTLRNDYTLHAYENFTLLNPDTDSASTQKTKLDSSQFIEDLAIIYLNTVLPKNIADKWFPMDEGVWGGFNAHRKQNQNPTHDEMENWKNKQLQVMASNRTYRLNRFYQEMSAFPKNTFHFAHVVFPHQPFIHLPSGKTYNHYNFPLYSTPSTAPDTHRKSNIDKKLHAHLLQVGFADTRLGEFIDNLKQINLFEESMIIVVSDHGISFKPKTDIRLLTKDTIGPIGFVPLFIKYPLQTTHSTDDTNVQTIDIVPTIFDVLNAKKTPPFDGRSLIDPNHEIPNIKRFVNAEDSIIEIPHNDAVALKNDDHQRHIDHLTLNNPKATLFQFGPGLNYLGLPENQILRLAIEADISTNDVEPLTNYDPNNAILNNLIQGTIKCPTENNPEHLILAISINGTIEGVSQPQIRENQLIFYNTLPETKLLKGENKINLYLLPNNPE